MVHSEDANFATWIRTGSYQPAPDDILTPEERARMKACCLNPRDKAMFETLYETAARPKEFLAPLKSDIGFDSDSGQVHIKKGKTGYPRDITLVQEAFPLLRSWIHNDHPLRDQPDLALWVDMSVNSKHDPLQQVVWLSIPRFQMFAGISTVFLPQNFFLYQINYS
ncbi:MAG: tyrosine-type recombinase/integrase [Nitrososphaerales archaeon]